MRRDAHTMLVRSRELRKGMTREEKRLYYDGLKQMAWRRAKPMTGNGIAG